MPIDVGETDDKGGWCPVVAGVPAALTLLRTGPCCLT